MKKRTKKVAHESVLKAAVLAEAELRTAHLHSDEIGAQRVKIGVEADTDQLFDEQGTTLDIDAGGGFDFIVGQNGSDADTFSDFLAGGRGEDAIAGQGGNDIIWGDLRNASSDQDGHSDHILGGLGNDLVSGQGGNDFINGGEGNDTVFGGGHDDLIFGGMGSDTLNGGIGNDVIYATATAAGVLTRTLTLSHSFDDRPLPQSVSRSMDGGDRRGGDTVANELNGDAGNDLLIGDGGNDRLDGGIGDDDLVGGAGADRMAGGADNDTYKVDNAGDVIIELAGQGYDQVESSVTLNLGVDVEVEKISIVTSGTGRIDVTTSNVSTEVTGHGGANGILGRIGDDTLNGASGNDTLNGADGADVLSGDIGEDEMWGGNGADTFSVDSINDKVIELANDIGEDVVDVEAGVHWTLGADSEVETIRIANAASTAAQNIAGNRFFQTIEGSDGINVINGEAGNDVIHGFGAGDTLLGRQGDDRLFGGAGLDSLEGGTENDTLDGGAGVDTLAGGTGDDVYDVDDRGDVIREFANEGNADRIRTTLNKFSIEDMAHIENLEASADITTATHLTGNALANVIEGSNISGDVLIGGGGNDTLSGALGADEMIGDAGNDTYDVNDAGDIVAEAHNDADIADHVRVSTLTGLAEFRLNNDMGIEILSAADEESKDRLDLYGNDRNQTLRGNLGVNLMIAYDGDDLLDGKGGVDTLEGGAGKDTLEGGDAGSEYHGGADGDTYAVRGGETIVEAFREGEIDTVLVYGSYVLTEKAAVEILGVQGPGNINITGNEYAQLIGGNDGGSVFDGAGGNDTIFGYGGEDTLIGGAGDDELHGGRGSGTDRMEGGSGDDLYVVEAFSATIVEAAGDTNDRVLTTRDFTLSAGAEIEFITADEAAGDIGLTGNELRQQIIGNGGNNVLSAGGGGDQLFGNGGNDTLVGGDQADILVGGADADVLRGGDCDDFYILDDDLDIIEELDGKGNDTVMTAKSYSLAGTTASIENLIAMEGQGDINLTGNDVANTLTGNSQNNILVGGGNADTLNGGAGDDVLDGGTGADVMTGGAGSDLYIVNDENDQVIETGDLETNIDEVVVYKKDWTLGGGSAVERIRAANRSEFAGDLDINITGNEFEQTIVGNEGANRLDGAAGNDTLEGGAGNDTLNGGTGADIMAGGAQDDLYFVDDVEDFVIEAAGEGVDTVNVATLRYSLSATNAAVENLTAVEGALVEFLEGSSSDNVITGNEGANLLSGLAGNDGLRGGKGDDTLLGGDGTDDLEGGDDNDSLVGGSGFNGLQGGQGNDTLVGGNDGDRLEGGSDDDELDGGLGDNILKGGTGNDKYHVRRSSDVVEELDNEGDNDAIVAYASFALSAGSAVESLEAAQGAGAINLTGNEKQNQLTGNDDANVLDGGAGDDIMSGGLGGDTYVVDSIGDQVIEAADIGASVDVILVKTKRYKLAEGAPGDNVEIVRAATAAEMPLGADLDIELTGNETSGNTLIGNEGNNILAGLAGNDTLTAGAGNDTIDGGIGADSMTGGAGNDTFRVDVAGDIVIEEAGQGNADLVIAGFDYTLTGGSAVENLQAAEGDLPIALTGNEQANRITGNDGANVLNGGAGADTLVGGLGDDTYVVGAEGFAGIIELADQGSDTVVSSVNLTLQAGSSIENLTAAAAGITLTGNELGNILTGRQGNNTLAGGDGDDIYVINQDDVIVEAAGGGTDTVEVNFSYSLAQTNAAVENLRASAGAGQVTLTGSTFDNTITANDAGNHLIGGGGNDILIGGTGADRLEGGATMSGGLGDDTYVIGPNGFAGIDEKANEGNDIALTSASITLLGGISVETLQAAVGNISLTGNNLNNTLIGGQGNNTLAGGAGDDTYVITKDQNDFIVETINGGNDTVAVDFDFTLGGSVELENIIGLGEADLVLVGSDTDNRITGNVGNNILRGNRGRDTLVGGDGNDFLDGGADIDSLVGGLGNDTYLVGNNGFAEITELADQGNDTVVTSANLALNPGSSIENLTAAEGASNIFLTGNEIDNVLTGRQGNNQLFGGLGNDTYVIDEDDDIFENPDGGTDTVEVRFTYSLAQTNAHVENLRASVGAGQVTLTGSTSDNTITANEEGNHLIGGGGVDELIGGAGNDTLEGGATMAGGSGDDTYDIGASASLAGIVEADGGGSDTVRTARSFVLANNVFVENLTATAAGISLTGNNLDNILTGGQGNNTLAGGLGNDTYVVAEGANDQIDEGQGGGNDTVAVDFSFSLRSDEFELSEVENLQGLGTLDITLEGNGANNRITGNIGNNILIGGGGRDTLAGGDGNDTYGIDSDDDVIEELEGQGTDTAKVTFSYVLNDNAEVENLTAEVGAGDISLTGSKFANKITGNEGNNVIDGAGGADTMIGGAGSDTYIVDDSGDEVIEVAEVSDDLVKTKVGYQLGAGVENLQALNRTGVTSMTLTGNDLNNKIAADEGGNFLNGGLGADVLEGLKGDDIYIVDNIGDQVIELADEGHDTTRADVARFVAAGVASYTAAANVEVLQAVNSAGEEAFTFIGNGLDNVIDGNNGANTLVGGVGVDVMQGFGGNDVYSVDDIDDMVVERAGGGEDTINSGVSYAMAEGSHVETVQTDGGAKVDLIGNRLANRLVGNAADNILDGDKGADTLEGGAGNDTYYVDSLDDLVVEGVESGANDKVVITGNITLTAAQLQALFPNVEEFEVLGNGNYSVRGGDGAQTLITGSGDNLLDGGAGADLLRGGAGNDTYIVDNVGDRIVERISDGFADTAVTSVSYTLGAGVEVEFLQTSDVNGTAPISLTGNGFGQTLQGNAANNVLNGGGGADILQGMLGDDTYFVDNAGTVVIEAAGGGTDSVFTSVDFAAAGVENINAIGSGNVTLKGDGSNNSLSGNNGNNLLDGGLGLDFLSGGGGNDTYVVDNAGDRVTEAGGGGLDEVQTSVTFAAGTSEIEVLRAMGAAGVALTGTAGNNTLFGNNAANALFGLAGTDTFFGGAGNDRLVGGLGKDTFTGGAGRDRFSFDDRDTATSKSRSDFILDFSSKQNDKIDLRAVDAVSRTRSDQNFEFIGKDAFTKAGQVRYEKTKAETYVYLNTDNDKSAEAIIKLKGAFDMQKAYFIL